MRPAALAVIGTALGASAGHALRAPFPGTGGDPVLDLIAYHDPGLHTVIRVWYYAAPAVAVVLAGSVCLSVWRVWLQPRARRRGRGRLPAWPASPEDDAPSLVIGELHHPTVPRESERPSWLVVPETGLYTGVLIVGAVGTGKTTACMYPFAQQLLSWQADRAGRRASALVLEVKGDFCYSVRRILDAAGRGGDYLEIGLDGSLQWNPLDDPLLDSYSLAYGVASLINQLFGKSREPFWQQAYTNLVRWIIENDWLEAIVALPLNMFYNTGIATYVWVLTNRKPEHRQGKVQLIDATKWFQSLRKNLGKKNCELGEEDIERICTTFMDFEESERSKIFDNEAFGYWKVTVERRCGSRRISRKHGGRSSSPRAQRLARRQSERRSTPWPTGSVRDRTGTSGRSRMNWRSSCGRRRA